MDGKGLEPSDSFPDGFEEANGIGVVGVNGPVDAPGAAVDAKPDSKEPAVAGGVVADAGDVPVVPAAEVEPETEVASEVASAVVPDAGVESVDSDTSDQQQKTNV